MSITNPRDSFSMKLSKQELTKNILLWHPRLDENVVRDSFKVPLKLHENPVGQFGEGAKDGLQELLRHLVGFGDGTQVEVNHAVV